MDVPTDLADRVTCGDIDSNGLGPDISDLVYLVSYMFSAGPEPACSDESVYPEADIDGNGTGPDYLPDNSSHTGFASHVVIGGCRNASDIFAGEWNAVLYSSPTDLTPSKSVSVWQWQLAVSWYHYFGPVGGSPYTVIGCGPYFLTPSWSEYTAFGGALLLGGGYGFTRHIQIGAYYSIGKVSSFELFKKGCHNLSVLLTVMGYWIERDSTYKNECQQ